MHGLPVVLHLFGDEARGFDDWFTDQPLPADLYSFGEPRDSFAMLGSPVLVQQLILGKRVDYVWQDKP